MKMPENKKVFDEVVKLIELNADRQQSKTDKLFVVGVYGSGAEAEVKVSVNGFSPDELDVIVREIYGRIYDVRVRNTKKGKSIEKKLSKKKNG